jgi:hypothetical protein
LPAAPLTEHFSIEPIQGNGIGTYYAYNSYSYINSVTQYISVTGDRSLLQEEVRGKTVLEWMIALAEWGEKDRDLDGNHLLDYGDDHNLLELKKKQKTGQDIATKFQARMANVFTTIRPSLTLWSR